MLFNSFNFLIFISVVFFTYLSLKEVKWQNVLLLLASYFFYGTWNYKFLGLLVFSTVLDYYTGLKIFEANSNAAKRRWLFISIFINLGFLSVFKYYNFFIDNFSSVLSHIGFQPNLWSLKVILPVGISFYTFHGLSYVLDIYKGKIQPTKNFTNYSLFVSFFPLLVAGPIERATHLLPQIEKPRQVTYEKAVDGLRQILWGLFKKMVVADNCATAVNLIFGNASAQSGSSLVLGAVFFAFQIYGDFSGYSDIAQGTARLLGFELLRNFAFPYFSRDIAEFWRRWHISLTSWFRDYVYYPLGGSRCSTAKKIRNTFIIFLLSGFWHGANWTFIFWGALNAFYFLPLLITNKNRNNLEIVAKGRMWPSLKELGAILLTFTLTVFAWIFFRAPSLKASFAYISRIFTKSLFSVPQDLYTRQWLFIFILVAVEWMQREKNHGLELNSVSRLTVRWSAYVAILTLIISYGLYKDISFIYFQF